MRYPEDHRLKARGRLLDDTARHVKKHGFSGSGVDAIAASAGVTSGALYKHFAGKSALFAAVIEAELGRTAQRFAAVVPGDRDAALKALAAYLSLDHVRHPEGGCPLPALTPEIARADDAVRRAFQTGLTDVHSEIERITGSSKRAWTLIAQCVGAVMLARAMPDNGERRALLEAATQEASALLADADSHTGERERARRSNKPRTEKRR